MVATGNIQVGGTIEGKYAEPAVPEGRSLPYYPGSSYQVNWATQYSLQAYKLALQNEKKTNITSQRPAVHCNCSLQRCIKSIAVGSTRVTCKLLLTHFSQKASSVRKLLACQSWPSPHTRRKYHCATRIDSHK